MNISDSLLISHRSIVDVQPSLNTEVSWEINIDDKIDGDTPVNIGNYRSSIDVSSVNTDVSLVVSIEKGCISPSI